MTFTLKITNGNTEVDFFSAGFSLTEGGLKLGATRHKGKSFAPLVGRHGSAFSEVDYSNRSVDILFHVNGSTYPELAGNIRTFSKLIREANEGNSVDLVVQVQDSDTSYLRILGGEIEKPDTMFSLEGVHLKQDGLWKLKNIRARLTCAPFFTNYFSGEKQEDVSRQVNTTITNGNFVSVNDIPGDIISETILRMVGSYSNGIKKVFVGVGNHSFETNLTAAIDSTQTSIAVDEDYNGKLLVPFTITIDSEDLKVTEVGSSWTVERGYNTTTAASHTLGTAVTINSRFDLDADDSLSYCDISVMRTGVVTGLTLNNAGAGTDEYNSNEVLTLSGNGNGDAEVRVLTVTSSGNISTFEIKDGGSGYTAIMTGVTVDSGTATFDVSSVASVTGTVTASTTDDLNTNYMNIALQGQGVHDLIEWDLEKHYTSVINQRVRFIGKEAQSANAWYESVNYRLKVGYRTDNDDSFIELVTTDWKTPTEDTDALFDFGSAVLPPTGSTDNAPDISIILQAQIHPEEVLDAGLSPITYNINLDYIEIMPVEYGFRIIDCREVPFFINDEMVDDSRNIAPYVQELATEYQGEVSVDGIMNSFRLIPTNAGNSVHIMFVDGGGTSSLTMTSDIEIASIGNYLGIVD